MDGHNEASLEVLPTMATFMPVVIGLPADHTDQARDHNNRRHDRHSATNQLPRPAGRPVQDASHNEERKGSNRPSGTGLSDKRFWRAPCGAVSIASSALGVMMGPEVAIVQLKKLKQQTVDDPRRVAKAKGHSAASNRSCQRRSSVT